MNARLLAAVVVLAVAGGLTATPAGAAPKTLKKSYAVSEPVPFPMTTDVPGMYGCIDGQEGVSKDTHPLTLPAKGVLKLQVTYTGDWDLYLLDSAGAMLAAAETTETGNTSPAVEKITYKKAKKGQQVSIVACNWEGLKDATVSYVFTYAR